MTRENIEKKVLEAVLFYLPSQEREYVNLDSRIISELCMDSLDRSEMVWKLEEEFSFYEKDAVWVDFLEGTDPSVRELCDFVEKRL